MLMENFRTNLRKFMAEEKLSYDALGLGAGISQSNIAKMMSGRTRTGTRIQTIEKICEAWELDPIWMLDKH